MPLTEFRKAHSKTRDCNIVEVWHDGKFAAALYPTDTGFRVISNHVDNPLRGVLFEDKLILTWDFEVKR